MRKSLKTYNFLIKIGTTEFFTEVNAYSEDEAINAIKKEYCKDEGYSYILL